MNYRKQLEVLIDGYDGIVFTKDVEKAGIPRYYLTLLVREDKLTRLSNGVYATANTFEDDMYILQKKRPTIIFSHETALYLHELTDRDPIKWSVTVPTGYNTTTLKEEGLQVHTIKREHHSHGTTKVKTIFGRNIITYNKERTICDILRNRKNTDISQLNEAIKRYLQSKDKNIHRLMIYAKQLKIQRPLRTYLEMFQ